MIGILLEVLKLGTLGLFFFLAFSSFAKGRTSLFGLPFSSKKRTLVLGLFMLIASATEIGNEVIEGDTAKVDKEILLSIKAHTPAEFVPFFEGMTFLGSFKFIAASSIAVSLYFVIKKMRFEAILMSSSTALGGICIYVLKAIVKRDRPHLWETNWYWGTSFPSGHTLASATFASALALCLKGVEPQQKIAVGVAAMIFAGLVGLSRLVLGVHWPTDVVTAYCIGMTLPHLVEYSLLLFGQRRAADNARKGILN